MQLWNRSWNIFQAVKFEAAPGRRTSRRRPHMKPIEEGVNFSYVDHKRCVKSAERLLCLLLCVAKSVPCLPIQADLMLQHSHLHRTAEPY